MSDPKAKKFYMYIYLLVKNKLGFYLNQFLTDNCLKLC